MQALHGKVAVVTGGSRGIGAAVVRQLAHAGSDVAFTYLGAADAAKAVARDAGAEGVRALPMKVDGADADAVSAAVHEAAVTLGGLDVLVHNAGIFPYGLIEEVSREELDRTLALHLQGVFVSTQAALGHLVDGGRIIAIGSCFAERVPVPGVALYAMTKSALIGLARGLARDLGPRGITVNVVHPGPTDTDMNPADSDGAGDERALTALDRYATADEIAATVVHLAGPAGAYLTGGAISVDGGYAA